MTGFYLSMSLYVNCMYYEYSGYTYIRVHIFTYTYMYIQCMYIQMYVMYVIDYCVTFGFTITAFKGGSDHHTANYLSVVFPAVRLKAAMCISIIIIVIVLAVIIIVVIVVAAVNVIDINIILLSCYYCNII